jgi:hypothetical protein
MRTADPVDIATGVRYHLTEGPTWWCRTCGMPMHTLGGMWIRHGVTYCGQACHNIAHNMGNDR